MVEEVEGVEDRGEDDASRLSLTYGTTPLRSTAPLLQQPKDCRERHVLRIWILYDLLITCSFITCGFRKGILIFFKENEKWIRRNF